MASSTAAGSSSPSPRTDVGRGGARHLVAGHSAATTPATMWVVATLAAYVAGFLLFPPRILLILDEERYVAQAMAFAMGRSTLPHAQILYPPSPIGVVTDYPPGTSLLQVPFVWLFGWRGAAVLSVIGLVKIG